MLQKTYEDYYPTMYNLDSFHIDEYMMIVMIEQLEPKFGVYFENCEENIVTP